MLFLTALKAIFLGVVVAAPVGPVGALVIRRTLRVGMALGLWTGIGAAVADASFGAVAILGMEQVREYLEHYDVYLAWVGGALLLALGGFYLARDLRRRNRLLASMESRPEGWLEIERQTLKTSHGNLRNYLRAALGSLVITFSNPVTIVGFAGAFAAFGVIQSTDDVNAMTHLVVVLGVLAGSFLWWLTLALLVRWLRGRLSNAAVLNIQLFTHGLIIFSGLLCIARGLSTL